MPYYQPGDPYSLEIETYHPVTGARISADSTPTAQTTRNGVDDPTFILTFELLRMGRYLITGTIPSNYQTDDQVSICVNARVAGVSGSTEVDSFGIISGM